MYCYLVTPSAVYLNGHDAVSLTREGAETTRKNPQFNQSLSECSLREWFERFLFEVQPANECTKDKRGENAKLLWEPENFGYHRISQLAVMVELSVGDTSWLLQ